MRHNTEAIRAAIDLPRLIGAYVRLRKAGKDWKGLCPFHEEKTPSFVVHAEYFKCFGCGVSGDAIDFVSRIERISTGEAIKRLAEQAGIREEEDAGPSRKRLRPATQALAEEAQQFSVIITQRLNRQVAGYRLLLDLLLTDWTEDRWPAMISAQESFDTALDLSDLCSEATPAHWMKAYAAVRTPALAAEMRRRAAECRRLAAMVVMS